MATTSFSFARYLGLDAAADATIAHVFTLGEVITGALAVVVGGSVFVTTAVRALRLGVVPLDLPIAVGLVLAFLGSAAALLTGSHAGVFFDSAAMFAALMLVGRLAQRSMLARSRAQLLEDDGFGALPVTRLVARIPEAITAAQVVAGDELLVRPGDAVPVASRLAAPRALFSLAWIDGESDPRELHAGDEVPAGACSLGDAAIVVTALEPARESRLAALLSRRDDDAPALDARWQRFAAGSVVAVLLIAIGAGIAWSSAGAARALEVATAILVVTCPCAIGLALPLASEIAVTSLRRRGVFVRRHGLLERLARVRHVVLDKTGTLTASSLVLSPVAKSQLALLGYADRAALFDLVARSSHPKSRVLHAAIAARHSALALREVQVVERAGRGLRAAIDGHVFELGRADGRPADDVVFTRDGASLARFTFQEELQPDAAREVAALRARGLAIHIASGDRAARALDVGLRLGVPASEIHAEASPEDKAQLVRALGADHVLFIGDGVNDVAAFAAAGCAGTPALDRPQLPARADFYVVARGLGPLSALFDAAARYQRGTRAALAFSLVYNAVAVALAVVGAVTPLVAAVAMPLSSVAVIVLVNGVMRSADGPRPRAARLLPSAVAS
jgi:Cu2+-exporting ATPase